MTKKIKYRIYGNGKLLQTFATYKMAERCFLQLISYVPNHKITLVREQSKTLREEN